DGPERMLYGPPAHAHLVRVAVEPVLHRLENGLVLPSGDPSLLAGGAALLDGAAMAGMGPVTAQDQSIFLDREVVGEPLICRTNVNVVLSHVDEVLLAEAACGFGTRSHWFR